MTDNKLVLQIPQKISLILIVSHKLGPVIACIEVDQVMSEHQILMKQR